MKGQNIQSVAQVKVNFMKNEDKIQELQSKASNRIMRDGSHSVVCELVDGIALNMQFVEGVEDVTKELLGVTVNLRFTPDQFRALNERFHQLGPIGALVQVALDGNVEYGTLVSNGVEVESYTIYVAEVQDVEEVQIQRVGSRDSRDAVLARMQSHKASNASAREAAIAKNRPTLQTKAAQSGVATADLFM
jgi:hypothetical protein